MTDSSTIKGFEGKHLTMKEKLLVKVTNLTKLAEIQQAKMIGMFDFIQILKEKVSKLESDQKKSGSHFQIRRQRDEWERKYYEKCEELERWKNIKFTNK